MPGLSLLDTAAGKGNLTRDAVFGEIFVHTAVDIETPALNLTHRWVRSGAWKLISFEEDPVHAELYDVKADPFEEHNLASEQPEKVADLKARIRQWWPAAR
jgi:uncharacterized sulfatase